MTASFEEHRFSHRPFQTTFYLASGPVDGPLMIFCHGWPAIAQTWASQLEAFAAKGYRVVAPDMPGYGRSSAPKIIRNYSLEAVNGMMAALLEHLDRDRAVWVGHDWGAVAVWSFAAHYPEMVKAVACLGRPYHTLEYGLEEVLKTVNRFVYPVDIYPYAQYDYQVYFQQSFGDATAWFEKDPAAFVRAIYTRGTPEEVGQPGITASVTRAEGWFGGASEPPAELRDIPTTALCGAEELYQEVVEAMSLTGFWGADAWYMNHDRNRAYSVEEAKDDGYLSMPVLFIGANWDVISDVSISTIAEAQKEYCKELKEVYLDAGHWVALEEPEAVNAAIDEWLKSTVGLMGVNVGHGG